MKTALLLGSGISYASGAPDTATITSTVLSGPWMPHTDWRYYPTPSIAEPVSVGDADRAQKFLRIIKEKIDPYLVRRVKREATYEDLYSAAQQIVDNAMIEDGNPMAADSIAAIRSASAHLFEGHKGHIRNNPFASLAERAGDLIQWAAFAALIKAREPKGLGILGELARTVKALQIFSLNHDLLVETQIGKNGLVLADGFGKQTGSVRLYDGEWPGGEDVVRLFKLHGSINWYLFRLKDGDRYGSVKGSVDYAKDDDGKLLDSLDVKPRFLTGTLVKEQAYAFGIIGDIFHQLRVRLEGCDTLIVSGYGWGDRGINLRLNEWLTKRPANRLVFLHPDPPKAMDGRAFWRNRWEQYQEAGKLVTIHRWLADCQLDTLLPYFSEDEVK